MVVIYNDNLEHSESWGFRFSLRHASAGAYELLNYKGLKAIWIVLKYNALAWKEEIHQVHYSKEQKNNQAFLNEVRKETEKSSGQDYNKNLIMRTDAHFNNCTI